MNVEEKFFRTYHKLRDLMGYVQNASDTVVTLFQDDATRSYFVKVGQGNQEKSYFGETLEEAIDKAYEAQPKD